MTLLAIVICETPLTAQDIQPEYLMMSDPELNVPVAEPVLPEGAISLWQNTLKRTEPDLVKAAADCIVTAHAEGFPGLEVCGPDLVDLLKSSDLHPSVTFALSRALIELDVSSAATLLFQVAQEGDSQLRMLIEPALALWAHQPTIDVWLQRLMDPNTRRRDLILACEGVATTQAQSAVPLLVEIALNQSRPSDLRLSAARAAGSISSGGLNDEAATLVGADVIDALCALSLLGQDSGDGAQTLLTTLASHEEPTVAAQAMRSLLNIDPNLAIPFAEAALQHRDPKIRQCGLDAYAALVTEERVPMIAALLNDAHPDVRTDARQALFTLGQDETFREQVLELAMTQMTGKDWRAQEQAAVLLVALDHKPAAPRLVQLLRSERPEVMVTSAWGLRVLAVPETADDIIKKIKRESIGKPSIPYGDMQLGHLFEACAVLREERAIASIIRHLPKDVTREKSRSAGIWAAGVLLEGHPNEELAAALMGRIEDVNGMVEELPLVRRMSAISIGRMRAKSQLKPLKELLGGEIHATPVGHAIGWAIEQLSGEKLPVAPARSVVRRGWLIEPLPSAQ